MMQREASVRSAAVGTSTVVKVAVLACEGKKTEEVTAKRLPTGTEWDLR